MWKLRRVHDDKCETRFTINTHTQTHIQNRRTEVIWCDIENDSVGLWLSRFGKCVCVCVSASLSSLMRLYDRQSEVKWTRRRKWCCCDIHFHYRISNSSITSKVFEMNKKKFEFNWIIMNIHTTYTHAMEIFIRW